MERFRRYVPSRAKPWDTRRAAHLHRRAAFGATYAEIARDVAEGPRAAVDRLLAGESRLDGVPDGFDELADMLAAGAVQSRQIERLKAWWLFRILHGPDPLTEKLALMWHNHFATSHAKVANVLAMHAQNETFRRLGRRPFGELLGAMMRDPALLDWLDANTNRKGRPNENLARELMELFTLGVGNYTERDVQESARALTGWTARRGRFLIDDRYHDDGAKTILGRTGRWNGEDVTDILLDQPVAAHRLAFRLCDEFLGNASDDADIVELAVGLRERKLDVGWGVETILRSERFFDRDVVEGRVRGPVDFVVGAVRALGRISPRPSTILLAEWVRRLGQDLFLPPNVGGWNGGAEWLGTRNIIGRANVAAAAVEGRLHTRDVDWPPITAWTGVLGVDEDPAAILDFFEPLLTGRPLSASARARVLEASSRAPGAQNAAGRAGAVVALLLAMPESQVG